MNDKAAELGCVNTHFNNPHGLSEGEDATLHYTCCYDMALIAKAAYQNETFRAITATKTYQIPLTNKHDEITYLQNHNDTYLCHYECPVASAVDRQYCIV